jgi:hypothetical protein
MGSFLSGMVTVAHHANIKAFAQGRGHVGRDSFFYIAAELCPVLLWEGVHVNGWVGWVEHKSRVVFLL